MAVTPGVLDATYDAGRHQILDVHAVHYRLWTSQRRTDTSRQTRFENLSIYYVSVHNVAVKRRMSQYFVAFNFNPAQSAFVIEVPEGSHWSSVGSMHHTPEMCPSCEVLRTNFFKNDFWESRGQCTLETSISSRPHW